MDIEYNITYADDSKYKLVYNTDKHSYMIGKDKVPSVTRVIDSCFPKYLVDWAVQEGADFFLQSLEPYRKPDPATFIIPQRVVEHIHQGILTASKAISEHAADVGSIVHSWISEGIRWKLGYTHDPPEMPEDEEAINCVNAFKKWASTKSITWLSTEEKVYYHSDNNIYRYAGTVDAVSSNIDGSPFVIDFKTSKKIYKPYYLQVAAYCRAIEKTRGIKPLGLILRLDKETGEFQEKIFDPQEHFAAFDLCLQLRKWSSTRIPKYDLSIRGPDKG